MSAEARVAAVTSEELVRLSKRHTSVSWSVQEGIDPIALDEAGASSIGARDG